MRPALNFLAMALWVLGSMQETQAEETQGIQIEAAVARPSSGANGAIFMALVNPTSEEDILVTGRSEVCEFVEIHDHIQEDGQMKMRPVSGLVIPAAKEGVPGRLQLASGGKHVMLMKLKRKLEVGQTFPLFLTFRKAGEMPIQVKVSTEVPVAATHH